MGDNGNNNINQVVEDNETEEYVEYEGKGTTIALIIIVLILLLVVGIGGGFLLSKKMLNKQNNNTEANQTQSTEINEKSEENSNEIVTNNSSKDYSKYCGEWTNTESELKITKIENNQISFNWFVYKLAEIDNVTLPLNNDKAVFYYHGYEDKNYNGKKEESELYCRKATIELKEDKIVITVENSTMEEVNQNTKLDKSEEFGGGVYITPDTYTFDISKEEKVGEEKTQTQQQTTQNNTKPVKPALNDYDTAVAEIKKCLKDKNWLKENVYIKPDQQVTEGDLSDQKVDFIICRGNKIPVIVIEVSSENARYSKVILVAYVNESVKSEIIDQGHIYHCGYSVDANKNIVATGFMHMGDNTTTIHKIENGNIKKLGMYGTNELYENGKLNTKYFIADETMINKGEHKYVSQEEYEKFKAGLNESQYKYVSIGTELTDANVDTYVK